VLPDWKSTRCPKLAKVLMDAWSTAGDAALSGQWRRTLSACPGLRFPPPALLQDTEGFTCLGTRECSSGAQLLLSDMRTASSPPTSSSGCPSCRWPTGSWAPLGLTLGGLTASFWPLTKLTLFRSSLLSLTAPTVTQDSPEGRILRER